MSKRKAKKQIETRVVDAIDQVILNHGNDEKVLDTKTDQLIDLFDKAMSTINGEYKIKGRSNKKKYFRDLFADVNKNVSSIVNAK